MEMKNNFWKNVFIHSFFLLLILAISIIYLQHTYSYVFYSGDNATFYSFGKNILDGEVIYKDFIHFRTPGSYYLIAVFLKIYGEEFKSVVTALLFEGYIIYPLILYIFSYFFLKNRVLSFIIALVPLMIPGPYQLRNGLVLLPLLFFSLWNRYKERNIFAYFVGATGGLTFWFGQEMALIAGIIIFYGCVHIKVIEDVSWVSLGRFFFYSFLGVISVVIPIVVFFFFYSDISNFFYYVFYYAFLIQPKGMDLPYPIFSFENIAFYAPLFVIEIYLFLLLVREKMITHTHTLLFSLVTLRMVSAMGRSDYGHLLFSITEVFIVLFIVFREVRNITKVRLYNIFYALFGVVCVGILFYLSISIKSLFLVFIPGVFLALLMYKRKLSSYDENQFSIIKYDKIIVVIVVVLIFGFFTLFIDEKSIIANTRMILSSDQKKEMLYSIEGTEISVNEYNEVKEVKAVLSEKDPQYIFSYPIRPFYYTFAQHAAPFMTFEPQTTDYEVSQTIKALIKNKPEVVIFDHQQAVDLSKALYPISDYLTTHYRLEKMILSDNIIHILIPKDTPSVQWHLLYRLRSADYSSKYGPTIDDYINILNEEEDQMIGALRQRGSVNPEMRFNFDKVPQNMCLSTKLIYHKGFSNDKEGSIKILSQDHTVTYSYNVGDEINIPLDSFRDSLAIFFLSKKTILWNDPKIILCDSKH